MANDTDIKIDAGHEFWVTTDPAYAESGSAEYMYVDYVSTSILLFSFDVDW